MMQRPVGKSAASVITNWKEGTKCTVKNAPTTTRRKYRPKGSLDGKVGHQVCGHCEAEKPLEDFHRKSDAVSGRSYLCRDCDAIRSRQRHIDRRTLEIAYTIGVDVEKARELALAFVRVREETKARKAAARAAV
jgi:hypothetical protein